MWITNCGPSTCSVKIGCWSAPGDCPGTVDQGGIAVALREFADERGRVWQVCDVLPTYVERRSGTDRRRQPRPGTRERRQKRQHRMMVAPRFRSGWLVFETRTERRRLGPIPPGWEYWTDTQLRVLLNDAEVLRSLL